MTISRWLDAAKARLSTAGDLDAAADADWLLCEETGLARSQLRWKGEASLSPTAVEELDAWLSRRVQGEPLQYILGHTGFMGYDFLCDRRALIPRFDTETLVDGALCDMRGQAAPRVLDMCCGTGCIGLSVALKRPDARVTLCDISPEALSLARENAVRLGADVSLREGDLFEAVKGERFDYILCNPPYLTEEDMASLSREVRFEPSLALSGGGDGLDFYRRIAKSAPAYLNKGGRVCLEVGLGQAGDVAALLKGAGFGEADTLRDMSGVERVVRAAWEATGQ